MRIKEQGSKTITRRSYTSTIDDSACITLFQDVAEGEETKKSTTEKYKLETSDFPIVYINTLTPRDDAVSDLLIVRKDGQIKCLGGEKLNEIWTSPSTAIGGSDGMSNYVGHNVLHAQLTDAQTASKGLLRGLGDNQFGFSTEVPEAGYNADILILITEPPMNQGPGVRTLHVVALPQLNTTSKGFKGKSQSVQNLVSTTLPGRAKKCSSVFSLHAPTGVLSELCGETLTTMDLIDTIPKVQKMHLAKSAHSFLRLSSTAIITSSLDSVDLYNPKFMSLQSSLNPTVIVSADAKKQKRKSLDDEAADSYSSCRLHSYFSKLELVIGITGSELVALQIETSPDRPGKRRASGLLIDSLGCGVGFQKRVKIHNTPHSNTFQAYLSPLSDGDWTKGKAALDDSVKSNDVDQFDNLMANYFGTSTEPSSNEKPAQWILPQFGEDYPELDQRFMLYALSQIFSWEKTSLANDSLTSPGEDEYQLTITLYPPNTFYWLIETGSITTSNIELSLKQCRGFSERPHIPAGQLVAAIVNIDPEMSLLLSVISKSFLSPNELLFAIRLLMQSLEIFSAGSNQGQLLTNGESMDGLVNGDAEAQFEKEEAAAEMALEAAEYHLGDGSSIRGQALSMALAKLYSCPSPSVVSALHNVFTTSETVSLIQLLRYELAMGSWTTRYLDMKAKEDEPEDDASSPNNSIVMISNLLNCCIDAIGTGGWLLADSTLTSGNQYEAEDLIEGLKLEVSAALQGIDEATYIKGLTGEMIRFEKTLQRTVPVIERSTGTDNRSGRASTVSRPILLPTNGKTSAILPIGLKAGHYVSAQRVGAGGELKTRSKRDIGRLKSQQVGKYSLERIVI